MGGRVSALLPRLSWQVSGFVLFRLPQFRLYRGDSGVGFTRVVVARVDYKGFLECGSRWRSGCDGDLLESV